MSDQENLDVGKVIGLIMENPQLIEQISNLAKRQTASTDSDQSGEARTNVAIPNEASEQTVAATYQPNAGQRGNRSQLLNALKPYVSSERARAIDSMMSIADILDLMKSR